MVSAVSVRHLVAVVRLFPERYVPVPLVSTRLEGVGAQCALGPGLGLGLVSLQSPLSAVHEVNHIVVVVVSVVVDVVVVQECRPDPVSEH